MNDINLFGNNYSQSVHEEENSVANQQKHHQQLLESYQSHLSWSVIRYSSTCEASLRLLFLSKDGTEILTFDAFSNKLTSKHKIADITKISYDRNKTAMASYATETKSATSTLLLFRLVFRDFDVNIFLSQDRNEIINSIVSAMRKINYDKLVRQQEDDTDEDSSETSRPVASRSDRQFLIPVAQPNRSRFSTDRSGYSFNFRDMPEEPKLYAPNLRSGYYEFQVFGVDARGRLYPHTLGLFSFSISHSDSQTKKIFAQHAYTELTSIDVIETKGEDLSKIQLSYENDNPYTFIVSDKDKSEVLSLLKGRKYLYTGYLVFGDNDFNTFTEEKEKNLVTEDDDATISMVSDEETSPQAQKLKSKKSMSSFPEKMSSNFAEVMESMLQESGHAARAADADLTDSSSKPMNQQEEQIALDVMQEHIALVAKGGKLLKFARSSLKRKPKANKRFFVLDPAELFIYWGSSESAIRDKESIEGLIIGDEVTLQIPKLPAQYQLYTFILQTPNPDNNLILCAEDARSYSAWTEAIKFLIERRKRAAQEQRGRE